jgi:hypothetical protein
MPAMKTYSPLIPAAQVTFPHLAISALNWAAHGSGVLTTARIAERRQVFLHVSQRHGLYN